MFVPTFLFCSLTILISMGKNADTHSIVAASHSNDLIAETIDFGKSKKELREMLGLSEAERKQYKQMIKDQDEKGIPIHYGGPREREIRERHEQLMIILIVLGSVMILLCCATALMSCCCLNSGQELQELKIQERRNMLEYDSASLYAP